MKIHGMVRKYGMTFFAGIVFAVLCFIVINAAMAPTSKSDYCGSKCHEMNTAYRSWELSAHGSNKYGIRIECVDCHLPAKDKYFKYIAAKAHAGAKDVYKHYFGGKYDVEEIREQVLDHIPNRRCMNCHNDLLVRPGSSAARTAHMEVLNGTDVSELRCVECHEDAGHERENKLFSP